MSDLPTRLRAYRAHDATADALLDAAAAEIERLRAAIQAYLDALYCYDADPMHGDEAAVAASETALRAALEHIP